MGAGNSTSAETPNSEVNQSAVKPVRAVDKSVQQASVAAALQNYSNTTDDVVPTVFKWDHGGKNVSLAGSFNNYGLIPMHKSGNDFSCIINLKRVCIRPFLIQLANCLLISIVGETYV